MITDKNYIKQLTANKFSVPEHTMRIYPTFTQDIESLIKKEDTFYFGNLYLIAESEDEIILNDETIVIPTICDDSDNQSLILKNVLFNNLETEAQGYFVGFKIKLI